MNLVKPTHEEWSIERLSLVFGSLNGLAGGYLLLAGLGGLVEAPVT